MHNRNTRIYRLIITSISAIIDFSEMLLGDEQFTMKYFKKIRKV